LVLVDTGTFDSHCNKIYYESYRFCCKYWFKQWVPGQILEGIAGLLAIIGAIVVGICLFLIYTGKIKTENGKGKQKQQPESLQRQQQQHQLEFLAKEEVDIVSSSLGWIINKYTNSLKNVISKENSTINGVKILVQNPSLFNADVYHIHSELNNALVTKNQKEDRILGRSTT
jgi:hypothetical protein